MFQDQYFDLKQLSKYSSLSVRTLRNHLGKIPCFRVGGKFLFRRSEFDRFIEQYRVENNIDEVVDQIMDEIDSTK
jgi:excisionase family DNA binding protein